ncbi:lactonase family protein [Phreatobacter oligotrophus]|uniref:6-phosphogluconolactonase n=1 Tax=Phreatobacter oligotrophus TaxID=1122261 RepID=A0A2T4Z320_9HYPH|nr:beta-propeller fold lactonase family protein [Phreatobacter oligotrophus]PTM55161.1 6-phosphogluconolactonase [Phreatobacter oligotrophus]
MMRSLFAAAATLAACLAAPASNAATMVYISNAESREIVAMALDAETGALREVSRVPTSGTAMPMAVSPDKRFLYVGLRSAPFSVSTFAIDPKTGGLAHVETAPLPDNMAYLSTDRTGRYLFSASYGGNRIAVTPIEASGVARGEPIQVIETRKNAHAILADRQNRNVFATNLGGDIVLQYRLDAATGRLAPNTPPFVETRAGAGPRHFVFHPNDRFVFLINELDGSINSYRYDAAAGTLAEASTSTAMPAGAAGAKPWAADIHLTPDGRFLYASERTTSTLTAYRVDAATGALTTIGSVPTETQPRGFNVDPRGRFLVAVGQKSNGATVYAIDQASGALRTLQQYPIGRDPNWVEIIDLP